MKLYVTHLRLHSEVAPMSGKFSDFVLVFFALMAFLQGDEIALSIAGWNRGRG